MNRRSALLLMTAGVGGAAAGYCGVRERVFAQEPAASRMGPDIPGPHPAPRVPTYKAPPQTCDTHCHVFGPIGRYPFAASRPYTPPEAPFDACRALHARLGVSRGVIVNATPYGRDNRIMTDAIATSGGAYRGIGNIDERMTDRELQALADAGVDGCRFTFLARLGGRPDLAAFDRLVERIAPLGWHVDLYLDAKDLQELAPRLQTLPLPYVIDHMGLIDASAGLEQPVFRALVSHAVHDDKCWIKITGPERISKTGPPFHDAVPFARTLVEAVPDRVLWGTDWPHPNVPYMPNDGDLMDLVPLFAPTADLQHRLLVANPSRLYRFGI